MTKPESKTALKWMDAASALTKNEAVLQWMEEMAAMTQPDKIVWITGEEEQLEALRKQAVEEGILIKLNEDGTKAAAVTAVVNDATSAKPTEVHRVVLDRPFVYMIVDTHANLPLFLGTVTQMDG